MLEGKDPETLELIQKINTLQKRLILKQEEIIEKDLKLEEIDKVRLVKKKLGYFLMLILTPCVVVYCNRPQKSTWFMF